VFVLNEFGRALDEGKEVRVVFCEISKAFDRVWHKGLLRKLESIGIRGYSHGFSFLLIKIYQPFCRPCM
jgi:hypothetical protein